MAFAKDNITDGRRPIKDGSKYNYLMPKPDNKVYIAKRDADAGDTIKVMQQVVKESAGQVEKLAKYLYHKNLYQFLSNIWNFLYHHIQYKLDDGEEVRTPARSWSDRQTGIDCDCFAVFIGTILYYLKIPFAFRITKYWTPLGFPREDYQHVYVVVPLDGENFNSYYTVDCVLSAFNYEKPFSNKKDFIMPGLNVKVLSGFGNIVVSDLKKVLFAANELEGLGAPGNEQQDLTKIYDHLVATRNIIAKNPKIVAPFDDPQAQLKMLDYAIKYFWTSKRDEALAILAANEDKWNQLNGFDDEKFYGLEGTFAGVDEFGTPRFETSVGAIRAIRRRKAPPSIVRYNPQSKTVEPAQKKVAFRWIRGKKNPFKSGLISRGGRTIPATQQQSKIIPGSGKVVANYPQLRLEYNKWLELKKKIDAAPVSEKAMISSLIVALNDVVKYFWSDKRDAVVAKAKAEFENYANNATNAMQQAVADNVIPGSDEGYIEEIPDSMSDDEKVEIVAEDTFVENDPENPNYFIDDENEGFGDYDDFGDLGKSKRRQEKKAKQQEKGQQKGGKKGFYNAIKNAANGIGKGLKNAGNAVIRYNPATIAARNGFLLAMKINFAKIAEKIVWGYGTEQQAIAGGKNAAYYQKSKKALQKIVNLFTKIGGKEENLKKAILSSKKAKATGLKGFLNGLFGIDEYNELGALPPVIVAASAPIAAALKILKDTGLFAKGEAEAYEAAIDNAMQDAEKGGKNSGTNTGGDTGKDSGTNTGGDDGGDEGGSKSGSGGSKFNLLQIAKDNPIPTALVLGGAGLGIYMLAKPKKPKTKENLAGISSRKNMHKKIKVKKYSKRSKAASRKSIPIIKLK